VGEVILRRQVEHLGPRFADHLHDEATNPDGLPSREATEFVHCRHVAKCLATALVGTIDDGDDRLAQHIIAEGHPSILIRILALGGKLHATRVILIDPVKDVVGVVDLGAIGLDIDGHDLPIRPSDLFLLHRVDLDLGKGHTLGAQERANFPAEGAGLESIHRRHTIHHPLGNFVGLDATLWLGLFTHVFGAVAPSSQVAGQAMRSRGGGRTRGAMTRCPQAVMLAMLLLLMPLMGCFGGDDGASDGKVSFTAEDGQSVPGGEPTYLEIFTNQAFTANVSASADGRSGFAAFLIDENGVMRDRAHTYPAGTTEIGIMPHPVDGRMFNITLTTEDGKGSARLGLSITEGGNQLVDGQRAFATIDWLTTQHNNRWCASASLHEGGASYAAAAEAMKTHYLNMGFDHVEVTDYADDPDQKNVVAYKWGQTTPDEWIVIGGHFDVAYAFTPPGGGTSEGANDDTSGSTVSLSVAEGLAAMEWDHTVVAALWACEEEGLKGSLAFNAHLPENVTIKAYMNFDMVSLNYPIVPPPGYGPYDLGIAVAGASDENLSQMLDWVGQAVDEDLAYDDTAQNDIHWEAAESCASDHCAFFQKGWATFNFFSAGGDLSFWQEWHSGTDNLDFMVTKAGGEYELGTGFNTLVWISLELFVHIDNTGDEFQGRWVNEA